MKFSLQERYLYINLEVAQLHGNRIVCLVLRLAIYLEVLVYCKFLKFSKCSCRYSKVSKPRPQVPSLDFNHIKICCHKQYAEENDFKTILKAVFKGTYVIQHAHRIQNFTLHTRSFTPTIRVQTIL